VSEPLPPALPSLEALVEDLRRRLGVARGQRVVGLGWATVDTDRAVSELSVAYPDAAPFETAAQVSLLGASCRLGRPGRPEDVRLAILEPVTEGRLAATLARHGEGPVVLWVAAAAEPPMPVLSSEVVGPFGRERLVLGGPLGDLNLLFVMDGPASTIDA
jgi:hypothetical protein